MTLDKYIRYSKVEPIRLTDLTADFRDSGSIFNHEIILIGTEDQLLNFRKTIGYTEMQFKHRNKGGEG